MHKISTYIIISLLVIVTVTSLSTNHLFAGPCEQPISYRIGEIDDRFGIASTTVQDLLMEAERVWEDPIERDLFLYDPEAEFVIDFIYDYRQQNTEAANSYEATLDNLEASHEEIISAYESASRDYDAQLNSYENQLNQYEADLNMYNETVQQWNERGGAPEDIRAELIAEQENLREQLAVLESQQQDLEVLRGQINELADRGNLVAERYNQTATTFTQRFGSSQEFSQATYDGDAIHVYQFERSDDLLLALVHELGHALGIGHVTSSDSIMYYLMEDQPLDSIALSEEDMSALRNVCEIDA